MGETRRFFTALKRVGPTGLRARLFRTAPVAIMAGALMNSAPVLGQAIQESTAAFGQLLVPPPPDFVDDGSGTPPPPPPPGPPAAQQDVGIAILDSCPALDAMATMTALSAGSQDLLDICARTINTVNPDNTSGYGLTSPELLNTLQRIGGEEALAPRTVLVRRQSQPDAVTARLSLLRSSVLGQRILGDSGSPDTPRAVRVATADPGSAFALSAEGLSAGGTGGAGTAVDLGPVSVFGDVSYQFGNQDQTDEISPFEHNRIGITVGADYRFTSKLVAGGALHVSRDRTDFDTTDVSDGGQDLKARTIGLVGYATYALPFQAFLEGTAGVARTRYDQTRRIVIVSADGFATGENETALSEFSGRQFTASAGLGKDLPIKRTLVSVAAHLNYFRAHIDAYEETGADGLDLAYGEQTIRSLTSRLSTQISHPVSRSFGVLVPQLYGAYIREFRDAEGLTVAFANDVTASPTGQPLSQYTLTPVEQDQNYFVVGTGVSATLPRGLAGFADFSTVLGLSDFSANRITVGMRKAF